VMVLDFLAVLCRNRRFSSLKPGTDYNLSLLEERIASTQQCRPDVAGAGSLGYIPRNFPLISSVPLMILFLILSQLTDISTD